MSNFGKNIRKIRNVKKLSQQAFAELFELKRGTLGAYEEGRSEPKLETIIKIANYFSISIDDLLTTELTVNKLLKFKGDLTLHGINQKDSFPKIPCITSNNEADYIKFHDKPHFIEDLPVIQVPITGTKRYRGYIISNLEMTNHDKGLLPKDMVLGEFVDHEDYHKIENGELVLIITSSQLVLRKFFLSGNTATLRAANRNIDDLYLNLSEIKELWLIKFTFAKKALESNVEIEEKLAFLEQEFMKLKKKL
ncbi:helix-turn-helix domain-containing protein [Echinicola sp. 20G]|uniref:helix-turn-helix domain-containing protein n=1 Tax=Echinicola sp. 20G TaxID=2781961 RepID=UPI001910742E|nr:helix-turn-helix transcriptional regulator [Echinicola sp. 20G]